MNAERAEACAQAPRRGRRQRRWRLPATPQRPSLARAATGAEIAAVVVTKAMRCACACACMDAFTAAAVSSSRNRRGARAAAVSKPGGRAVREWWPAAWWTVMRGDRVCVCVIGGPVPRFSADNLPPSSAYARRRPVPRGPGWVVAADGIRRPTHAPLDDDHGVPPTSKRPFLACAPLMPGHSHPGESAVWVGSGRNSRPRSGGFFPHRTHSGPEFVAILIDSSMLVPILDSAHQSGVWGARARTCDTRERWKQLPLLDHRRLPFFFPTLFRFMCVFFRARRRARLCFFPSLCAQRFARHTHTHTHTHTSDRVTATCRGRQQRERLLDSPSSSLLSLLCRVGGQGWGPTRRRLESARGRRPRLLPLLLLLRHSLPTAPAPLSPRLPCRRADGPGRRVCLWRARRPPRRRGTARGWAPALPLRRTRRRRRLSGRTGTNSNNSGPSRVVSPPPPPSPPGGLRRLEAVEASVRVRSRRLRRAAAATATVAASTLRA